MNDRRDYIRPGNARGNRQMGTNLMNVFPAISQDDIGYLANADAELSSEWFSQFARFVSVSDFLYCFFRYFTAPMPFARRHPSLFRGILPIVVVGSKKEMTRINTRRVVASVAGQQPGRNLTEAHFPRNSRSWPHCSRSDTKKSVTPRRSTCRPNPAWPKLWSVGGHWSVLIDMLPKSLRVTLQLKRIAAFLATAARSAACKAGWFNLELLTANRTLKLHSITLVDCLPRLRLFVQRAGNYFEYCGKFRNSQP